MNIPPVSHRAANQGNSPQNQSPAVDYFYTATNRRSRGALWSIFAPALIDMIALSKKARAAGKAIKKYHEELLLVADACRDSVDLPTGFMTEPELPVEAITLLLTSLLWVQKLAALWESPNAKQLMKSKGMLFLLIYVWLTTRPRPSKQSKDQSRDDKTLPETLRLSNAAAQEIAHIVHIYLGVSFMANDLSDKIKDFATKEPDLFNELVDLLRALHRKAGGDQLARR